MSRRFFADWNRRYVLCQQLTVIPCRPCVSQNLSFRIRISALDWTQSADR